MSSPLFFSSSNTKEERDNRKHTKSFYSIQIKLHTYIHSCHPCRQHLRPHGFDQLALLHPIILVCSPLTTLLLISTTYRPKTISFFEHQLQPQKHTKQHSSSSLAVVSFHKKYLPTHDKQPSVQRNNVVSKVDVLSVARTCLQTATKGPRRRAWQHVTHSGIEKSHTIE